MDAAPEAQPHPAPKTTLALIDDHKLILDGLSTWVRANAPDFDLVIAADRWSDLIRHPAFPPEVVVMDYQLAEPISIEARLGLCRAAGSVVVVMSAVDDQQTLDRIAAAGAASFVSKSRPAADVVQAARLAVSGQTLSTGDALPGIHSPVAADDDRFTPRELEMLNLYADGNSPLEVAVITETKVTTVKLALERFRQKYRRLGTPADDRESLIRRAAEDGYLS